MAGQIPLVPGNMSILDSSIKRQCRLTLRHINRIVKAMDSNTELRHIVQGICFLTHPSSIPAARKEWEKRTNNAIVDYVVVTSLPRAAQVEWCVWAHRDNNRFECKFMRGEKFYFRTKALFMLYVDRGVALFLN